MRAKDRLDVDVPDQLPILQQLNDPDVHGVSTTYEQICNVFRLISLIHTTMSSIKLIPSCAAPLEEQQTTAQSKAKFAMLSMSQSPEAAGSQGWDMIE
ncbi:hypothetical protein CIB48_g6865 [Xylaria polymorpha]|nr:hypothetical protein CIB48_g6865 [Xylaria polymorpha]